MRIHGALLLAGAAAGALLLPPAASAGAQYDPAMVEALAAHLGTTRAQAIARLDREQRLSHTLADLQADRRRLLRPRRRARRHDVQPGSGGGSDATGFYSFYQPVVDAANCYGVTLTTS